MCNGPVAYWEMSDRANSFQAMKTITIKEFLEHIKDVQAAIIHRVRGVFEILSDDTEFILEIIIDDGNYCFTAIDNQKITCDESGFFSLVDQFGAKQKIAFLAIKPLR